MSSQDAPHSCGMCRNFATCAAAGIKEHNTDKDCNCFAWAAADTQAAPAPVAPAMSPVAPPPPATAAPVPPAVGSPVPPPAAVPPVAAAPAVGSPVPPVAAAPTPPAAAQTQPQDAAVTAEAPKKRKPRTPKNAADKEQSAATQESTSDYLDRAAEAITSAMENPDTNVCELPALAESLRKIIEGM